jgi:hypothetical protein
MVKLLLISIIDLHHCIAMGGNVEENIEEVAWIQENYLQKV